MLLPEHFAQSYNLHNHFSCKATWFWLCTKSLTKLLACEAGVGIKPGAQAPGQLFKKRFEPVKTGDSVNVFRLSPAIAGSRPGCDWYLGLAPQALCLRLLRRLCRTFRAKPLGLALHEKCFLHLFESSIPNKDYSWPPCLIEALQFILHTHRRQSISLGRPL